MNWLSAALNDFYEHSRFGTHDELADHFNAFIKKAGLKQVTRASVTRWLGGSMPKPEYNPVLVEAIGGDLRRALPGYDATPELAALKKERDRLEEATTKYRTALGDQWIGEVCAGPGRVVLHAEEEGAPPPSQSALERIARTHRHYKLGHGPIYLLAVRGDSMEPLYPEGCTVLARQIDAPDDVPNHADVLIYDRTHDLTLFRRLFSQKGKPIIAAPLNSLYEPDYFKPDDVILTHIVVGTITT